MDSLSSLLQADKIDELRTRLANMIPADAANALEELDIEQIFVVFHLLPKDLSAAIFTYLSPDLHVKMVEALGSQEMTDIVNRLKVDDAVDFLDELPANMVNAILANTRPEMRASINSVLNYPEDSAGSLMTCEYVFLPEYLTAGEALAQIRQKGIDKETIYTCYVTTPKRVLKGAVSLRQILLSPNSRPVSELMSPTVISANTHESQEEVSRKFQEYDLIALPVVDNENRIVGIITIDDVVDVIVAMNTENIEKMAALRPAEDEYMKTGVLKLASNRIVWLLFMMLSATFTGMIISNFQGLLSQMVILASFIPMLMDTGGNCGSQSATLIIRGMAVGEIDPSCWYKVVWKEFRIGIIVGVALGVVNLLRIFLFMKDVNFAVDLTVTATLFCTIITAKILGCLLPMLAKVMKLDPALMASPMITTCVDAITLMLYFTIARSVLL